MNMINAFNKTINYIETVLDGDIDERMIFQLSGYSYAMFSRIFSILTDMTLTEYIRLRKLTVSAVELRETQDKVIDIAVKYGYDSPDSFTAAFKSFHGTTPTEVRKGKSYNVCSSIHLSLSIKGGRTMDISIQKKPSFSVAGIKMEAIDTAKCPQAWEKLFAQTSVDRLIKLGNGQSYGICFDIKDSKTINYMAGFDVIDQAAAKKLNLEVMDIPANEYAVVKIKGAIPHSIHQGWKYLMEVFFPENGYQHSGAPDFEVYSEGDMFDPNYEMEIWVPIKKS